MKSGFSADTCPAMRIPTAFYAAVVVLVEIAWVVGLVYGLIWLIRL
jgi:hypothetical protein